MTHYEVLGVAPDAGQDAIRAAYRARARALHPDRRGGDPDAARQMAAVNRAWAVLADPARRAEYDHSLRPGDPDDAAQAPPVAPRYFEHDPPPVYSAMPGCLGSGALPWLALVAVLVVIFIFTAYAGTGESPESPTGTSAGQSNDEPPLVAVRDVRGMCIRVAGGINSVVDCLTDPNEGRIVAQASIGASCPPGTEEWVLRYLDTLACTEATATAGP